MVLGSWNPESTICPFRARKWPSQAPKTLRFKGKMANFEAKKYCKTGKKKNAKRTNGTHFTRVLPLVDIPPRPQFPNSPQTPFRPLGASPAWRAPPPPLLEFSVENRPSPLPAPRTPPSPSQTRKKIKNIRNVHQVPEVP